MDGTGSWDDEDVGPPPTALFQEHGKCTTGCLHDMNMKHLFSDSVVSVSDSPANLLICV